MGRWLEISTNFFVYCSPTGKLVQIEYALNAVSSGAASVGIKANNGIVLATENKQKSILYEEQSVHKIESITNNIGMIYSGMGPDYRLLVRQARKMAQGYETVYGESIPTSQLVQRVAGVMQEYTQSGGVRPFGVSLLICGIDDGVPLLFQCDPSGAYFAWKATAMGKNCINGKTFLEKRWVDWVFLFQEHSANRNPLKITDTAKILNWTMLFTLLFSLWKRDSRARWLLKI